MVNSYEIKVGETSYTARIISARYRPGKYDGPYEFSYPDESEMEWTLVAENGEDDDDAFTKLSEDTRASIEEELWKIYMKGRMIK